MAKKKKLRPLPAQVDSEFVGLIMAHWARRLTARNMLIAYGTSMGKPPGFGFGGTSDLYVLYEDLLHFEDAMETSEGLLELIERKRIQAIDLLERVKSGSLTEEEANEHVRQVVLLQREITRLTEIMEGMAGA